MIVRIISNGIQEGKDRRVRIFKPCRMSFHNGIQEGRFEGLEFCIHECAGIFKPCHIGFENSLEQMQVEKVQRVRI